MSSRTLTEVSASGITHGRSGVFPCRAGGSPVAGWRVSYRQVVSEWAEIEALVLKLVRSRTHRVRRRTAAILQDEPRAAASVSMAALCS